MGSRHRGREVDGCLTGIEVLHGVVVLLQQGVGLKRSAFLLHAFLAVALVSYRMLSYRVLPISIDIFRLKHRLLLFEQDHPLYVALHNCFGVRHCW